MIPNIKTRKMRTSRRWTSFVALVCFSVFISFFCLGGTVEAANVSIDDRVFRKATLAQRSSLSP